MLIKLKLLKYWKSLSTKAKVILLFVIVFLTCVFILSVTLTSLYWRFRFLIRLSFKDWKCNTVGSMTFLLHSEEQQSEYYLSYMGTSYQITADAKPPYCRIAKMLTAAHMKSIQGNTRKQDNEIRNLIP